MASHQYQYVLPLINVRLCTGCGLCVELCPTRAVTILGGLPVITRPEDCTFCEVCESYCPEGAIERPFTITFAPDATRLSGRGKRRDRSG
ncbi:MAG: 4Fe-4S binding protein [Oscillochloridaceae bacterium]|nr:4Fe-4S binding protein [Chloroflexaceae bacterium]MDW8389043.1 4Fe-4S binding protein [Oscillochloridaceae bacterium]